MIRSAAALCAVAVLLAGCALFGGRERQRGEGGPHQEGPPPGAMLLKYDLNHDGKVTCAELEAGLKAEFAAADKNHDGRLDPDEVRAVNEARWEADHLASPVVDWNHDGYVDFAEFATEARSLFAQLDVNNDCVLTPEELRGTRPGARAPGAGELDTPKRRGRRGRGGQGPGGGGGDSDGDGPGG